MKISINYRSNNIFTTFVLPSDILASHIFIGDRARREIIAEDVFEFMNTVYDEFGGFKSFKDIDHFIDNSYLWYITYDGVEPKNLSDFDISKVYVISVFRNKHGLKMVGMARRKIGRTETDKYENTSLKQNANAALVAHIKFTLNRGWAEVSGKLENAFWRVSGLSSIINPYDLVDHKIFKDIDVDIDELHYYRSLQSGEVPTRKIAFGTIKL